MAGNIDWFEIRRKIFHILLGIALILLIYFNLLELWMIAAILGVGVAIALVYTTYNIPIIHQFINIFEREHLRKNFPGKGVILLFIGVLLTMLLFNKNIVLASIAIWTFGDSVSALVGKHYGRIKNPLNNTKLLEGTIVGIILSTIAASFFVAWYFALVGAVVGMIIESIDFKLYHSTLDDNLLIPIISGFAIYLVMLI